MGCCCFGKHDPGPCPVDDAPHTTCTSPDYDPSRYTVVIGVQPPVTLTVPLARPGISDRAVTPQPQSTTTEVSTVTYRRTRRRLG